MFIQIVEWVMRFTGLLNDAKTLASSCNRKKLGGTFVRLYTLLSRIADNAERIYTELQRIQRHIVQRDKPFYDGLDMLLGDQRQLLKELQNLVRDNEALINVYGNNIADEISYVASVKISLIDVITTFSLSQTDSFWWGRDHEPAAWIPTSFDLNDIPEFREALEWQTRRWKQVVKSAILNNRDRSWRFDFQNLFLKDRKIGFSPTVRKHLKLKLEYPSVLLKTVFATETGKNKKADTEVVNRLLDQMEQLQSVKRLREARNIIAGIMREFFKIDELF